MINYKIEQHIFFIWMSPGEGKALHQNSFFLLIHSPPGGQDLYTERDYTKGGHL